ncbi:MAG TPA: hypothetical protein VM432_03285, partial [Bdellovibrionales bacterium]|nr:hypothetical protein [Bdellovibrionales bacterium]
MRLVLENKDGQAVRTFNVQTANLVVISRRDTRRVEVVATTANLDTQKVPYEKIAEVTVSELEQKPLAIAGGRLRVAGLIKETVRNTQPVVEDDEQWKTTLKRAAIAQVALILLFLGLSLKDGEKKPEEKEQIVQIVKRIELPKPQPERRVVAKPIQKRVVSKRPTPRQVVKRTKVASVKRVGALSVFGSMSKSKQRGGVNLGAVNTSAGPGLG